MSMQVNDHRTKDTRPAKEISLWLVATDKFMSGWGMAPGSSYVAYPADNLTMTQRNNLESWMDERSDFIRVRTNSNLPRGRDGDHLSIYDLPNSI